ncbi:uncharacterized protein LOC102809095 [Saccoglossus kowalevskii]|uniref:Zinc finger protein Pegasus-like n=1 Tax=Saccoglossus kowalevskii TaxID=10224 RepID=A0ABM0MGG4_SACKO|nr:PREDICTED: zinc finger protein Pegasus-like [Saccoglossus kowalevskii]
MEVLCCTRCPYTTNNMSFYESHLENHKGDKIYKCRYCNYISKYAGNRMVHERRMHLNKKPYECKYCDYATVQSTTLHKHVLAHHREQCIYKCPHCEFCCDSEPRYTKHVVKHAGDSLSELPNGLTETVSGIGSNQSATREPYTVVIDNGVPEISINNDAMDIKIEGEASGSGRHSDSQYTSTEITNLYTAQSVSLDSASANQGENNSGNYGKDDFSCNKCSFKGQNLRSLYGHMRTHAKEKKFKCRYCDYSTAYPTNRLIHERRHLGKKPYKCKLCPYAATQSNTLNVHMKQKHNTCIEKIHCNLCQFQCVLEDVFIRHLRDFHADIAVVDPNSSQTESTVSGNSHLYSNAGTSVTYSTSIGNMLPPLLAVSSTCAVSSENLSNSTTTAPAPMSNYFSDFDCFVNPSTTSTPSRPTISASGTVDVLSPIASTSTNDVNAADDVLMETESPANPNDESSSQDRIQRDPFPISLHRHNRHTARSATPTSSEVSATSTQKFSTATQTSLTTQDIVSMLNEKKVFRCQHCDILFPDNVLFTIHRGFHGYDKPFQCNICGHDCGDKYEFASHSHSCQT